MMDEAKPPPHPDEINRAIIQRMKSLIVVDQKIERLQKLRAQHQADIDRLMKLAE